MDKLAYTQFLNSKHTTPRGIKGLYYWWVTHDTEDNFKKNIDKLEYYKHNPITYKINEQLFRSNFDFDDKVGGMDVDVALGCSHTLGIGHSIENTWPFVLSEKTDRIIINLGAGGHGVETSYINLKKYNKHFNIKNVFHYQPIQSRYYFYNGKHCCFGVTQEDVDTSYNDEYRKQWLISDELILHNHHRGIDAIRGVCSEYGLNYFCNEEPPTASNFDWKVDEFRVNKDPNAGDIPARDLIHYSMLEQKEIANWFYKEL